MNYENIATTGFLLNCFFLLFSTFFQILFLQVFPPMEYRVIGLAEEVATERYGERKIEVCFLSLISLLSVLFYSNYAFYLDLPCTLETFILMY